MEFDSKIHGDSNTIEISKIVHVAAPGVHIWFSNVQITIRKILGRNQHVS